jgi:hypothetical protein
MFRDSGADAVSAKPLKPGSANMPTNCALDYQALCGAEGATTFKIRGGVGGGGGGVNFNGYYNGSINTRLYGGVLQSTLIVEEIQA